jgi:uncharacterized protein
MDPVSRSSAKPCSEKPVLSLGRYLKSVYGRRLRRVMLDLGLTCPNRDGEKGYGGCIYCTVSGSGTGAAKRRETLDVQWHEGLKRVRRLNPEGKAAILYFQSYSNTYPDLNPLAEGLAQMQQWTDVAPILSIGTRPDCFSREAAELIAAQTENFDQVWVEFGLETADDEVQKRIERFDTLDSFYRACELATEYGLQKICHCIAGLPGEKEGGLLRQVEAARLADVQGIKFHQLMVLRRTQLAKQWMDGGIELLDAESYAQMVADAVEVLPPEIVVHRLVAESPAEEYLAPNPWPGRGSVHSRIENILRERDSWQGKLLATC